MAGRNAVSKIFEPALEWMATRYQAAVGRELRKYGLRYDDLLDATHDLIMSFLLPLEKPKRVLQDVQEALKRIPPIEEDLRYQRLKRASDCSLKKSYLSKDVQEKQTPYNFYLQDALEEVQAENAERALLGTGKTYDRSIP